MTRNSLRACRCRTGPRVTHQADPEAERIDSRDRLRRLAEEHAALRRVATLVARGAPADEIFASVSEEAARVLELPTTLIVRYLSDDEATVMAVFNAQVEVGSSWPLDGPSIAQL